MSILLTIQIHILNTKGLGSDKLKLTNESDL